MQSDGRSFDYEPVTRSRLSRLPLEREAAKWLRRHRDVTTKNAETWSVENKQSEQDRRVLETRDEHWSLRGGHALTFAALFLYSAIAYFRPYELTPALAWTVWLPYWIAIGMLAIFIPSQIIAEGNLTARPREVNLVLLLGLIAILSIPQAISPELAWKTFNALLMKTIIVFIVMVNAMRTERRLNSMIVLSLAVGVFMAATAMHNYTAGGAPDVNNRARAEIGNMFGNPNSLAVYLVMMIPLAGCLCISASNILKRLAYGMGALLMVAGTLATLSRGGFLALVGVSAVLAFKLLRRNRPLALGLILAAVIAAVVLKPGGYNERMATIADPNSESSASARRELLYRSISVSLHKPILGVGIGNFEVVGIHSQVTHNAYTQVSSEMGLVALILYVMLMVVPYRRLRKIETETLNDRRHSRTYYLAVGLQASLVGYMVGSFFLSAAYEWYVYSLVAYAICLRRLYEKRMRGEENVGARSPNRTPEIRPSLAGPALGDDLPGMQNP